MKKKLHSFFKKKALCVQLMLLAAAPLLSGIIGLLGDSAGIALLAAAVLVIGTGIGIGRIASVQKKYNGGMF